MSKNIIGASFIALFFSSVCFANVQDTSESDPVAPAEMKQLVLMCDGHEGDATSTPEMFVLGQNEEVDVLPTEMHLANAEDADVIPAEMHLANAEDADVLPTDIG